MILKNIFKKKSANHNQNFVTKARSGFGNPFSTTSWSTTDYETLSREGYMKNIVAYCCVKMIASSAACISLKVESKSENTQKQEIESLLLNPNLMTSKVDFLEEVYSYLSIYGNAYILA